MHYYAHQYNRATIITLSVDVKTITTVSRKLLLPLLPSFSNSLCLFLWIQGLPKISKAQCSQDLPTATDTKCSRATGNAAQWYEKSSQVTKEHPDGFHLPIAEHGFAFHMEAFRGTLLMVWVASLRPAHSTLQEYPVVVHKAQWVARHHRSVPHWGLPRVGREPHLQPFSEKNTSHQHGQQGGWPNPQQERLYYKRATVDKY